MVSEHINGELQALVLNFGSNVLFADTNRHHKKTGTKDKVSVSIVVFNGTPQLRVAYGKTFYNFDIIQQQIPQDPLTMLKGFKGISELSQVAIDKLGIDAKALELRARQLRFNGI